MSRGNSGRALALSSAVAAVLGITRFSAADNVIADGGILSLSGATNPNGLRTELYSVPPPNSSGANPQFNADQFPGLQASFTGMGLLDLAYTGVNFPTGFGSIGAPFFSNVQGRFSGYFNAPSAGTYTFGLNSSDGSVMWIDGVLAVNDNKFQPISGGPQVTQQVTLSAGSHEFLVGSYKGTGSASSVPAVVAYYQAPPGNPNSAALVAIPINDGTQAILSGTLSNAIATSLTNNTNPADNSGNVILNSGATGVISVTGALATQFGNLTFNGGNSTLNLKGTDARFGVTTFTGGGVVNLAPAAAAFTGTSVLTITKAASANDQSIALGQLVGDGINPVTINKNGPYNLLLDQTTNANTLVAGSAINIKGGGLVLYRANGGNSPIGDGIPITLGAAGPSGNGVQSTLYLGSKGGDVFFDNPVNVTDNATIALSGPVFAGSFNPILSNVTIGLGSANSPVSVAGGKTLTIVGNSSNTLAISGNLTGAGTVVNTGNVQLNGQSSGFSGTLNVTGGNTRVSDAALLSAASTINVNNSALGGQFWGVLEIPASVSSPNLSHVNVQAGGFLKLDGSAAGGSPISSPILGTVQFDLGAGNTGSYPATLVNLGTGTIEARSGIADLSNTTIYGGTLQADSGGELRVKNFVSLTNLNFAGGNAPPAIVRLPASGPGFHSDVASLYLNGDPTV